MRTGGKKVSFALCGLAGAGLLMMSLCTKDTPLSVEKNPQTEAAASARRTVVKIISPTAGATFCLGDSVLVQAMVHDSVVDSSASWRGTVSFYNNNVLVGKDSVPPFMCSLNASTLGSNVIVATARASGAPAGSDTIRITVRDAFISITSPYNYETFSPGDTIKILATPIETARHTVASVDFYRNGTLLGSKSRAPFSYVWVKASKGTYDIKVVAHDTKGKLDSAKVSIYVVNQPPSVYIYSPSEGAVFFKGDTVKISAWASDSDGSVSRVLFYKNGKLIGTGIKPVDTTGAGSFMFSWYDTALGTFTLTAKAIDNGGDTGISMPVSIIRQDGFIILTAPNNNQIFETGSSITITASAVETRYHTVKSVKFFRNNKLLSTVIKAPYQYIWQNAANGSYSLMAVATDSKGKIDTSNIAAITVKNIPPRIYLSAYGANGGSNNQLLQSDTLILWTYVDDTAGSVVKSVKFYENGKLIATKYSQPFVYSFSLKNTPVGKYAFYVVAANQIGTTAKSNTDSIWVVAKLPQITLTSPVNGAVFSQSAPVLMSASVKDLDSVSYVKFMLDSMQVLAMDYTAPYSATALGLASGYHMINAVAVTSSGREYGSNLAFISIADSQPPKGPDISLVSPRDSSVFLSTDTILIQASVTDSTHSIERVTFFADSAFLGIDSLVPYTYTWVSPPKGIHSLWADATTFGGVTKSSSPVRVTVR
jgi:hypothetical protein